MDILRWLFDAQIPVGGGVLLVREVLGNIFGLASALGGMRRKIWAWPVGIVGNLLLLTVFLGTVFDTPHPVNLLGQAGRQIMFIAVAVYGWRQWRSSRADTPDPVTGADASTPATSDPEMPDEQTSASDAAVVPRWAPARARWGLVVAMLVGTAALTPIFRQLGSYDPVWADAWTFVGSALATYGMAKGWVEFWLIWVAVDVVGVPLLFSAGYIATGTMYGLYGLFTLAGFFVWARARERAGGPDPATASDLATASDPATTPDSATASDLATASDPAGARGTTR